LIAVVATAVVVVNSCSKFIKPRASIASHRRPALDADTLQSDRIGRYYSNKLELEEELESRLSGEAEGVAIVGGLSSS